MRIDAQITKIIPYWMHVFVQDSGANKHKMFFLLYFSEIITIMTFVIYRLLVT
jgi:hypothetical protein